MPVIIAIVAVFVLGTLLVKLVKSAVAGLLFLLPGFLALLAKVLIVVAVVVLLVVLVRMINHIRSVRSAPRVPGQTKRPEPPDSERWTPPPFTPRPGPAGSGATFLPPPRSERRQEPRRYHDEPITITIVVDRSAELIGAVDQLRGPIRLVRAGEVDKVVIGVGNDIDCEFTYVVKEMDVDLGEFWHDLSVEARAVLAELVAEPANKEAIHRFQELLVASQQRDPHLVTELPAAGRVELDVGTCRVYVVDDHRHIPVRRRPVIASTTLPLADVLKSNDRLVRLFAEAVADPDAGRRFAKNARAMQNKEPTAQFLGRCRPDRTRMVVKRGVFDVPEAAVVDFAPDPSYTLDLQHMVKDVRVPSHALADVQKKTQDVHGPGIGF